MEKFASAMMILSQRLQEDTQLTFAQGGMANLGRQDEKSRTSSPQGMFIS